MDAVAQISPDLLQNLTDLKRLRGIGPQLANKLAELNIHTILDLLLHLPYKYQDKTRITNIIDLKVNSHAVIEGEVIDLKVLFTKNRKRNLVVYLQDVTSIIELRFFNFNNSQLQQFSNKPKLRCFGEVKYGQRALCIMHPEYQVVDTNFSVVAENLTPVYPTVDGFSQKRWRQIIEVALEYLDNLNLENDGINNIIDYLPMSIIEKYKLLDFITSLKIIHRPTPDISIELLENRSHPAQRRLIFDELLSNQLGMQLIRNQQCKYRALKLEDNSLNDKFKKILPFALTSAQNRVAEEIIYDMQQDSPMCRLVQGDVGSGKTIVAAMAMLQAVSSGHQAVMMAPTEILAQQHYDNLQKYFEQLGISIALLIAKITASQKQQTKQNLQNNTVQIIIGTHALIQENVKFNSLGLVVIDEQHRFGVGQRLALWEKGVQDNRAPHQLTMTATPIPRTLAQTIYADMDYSVIDELPPGRKPITTVVVPDKKKADIINRIRILCEQNSQIYWVCTLIDDSENIASQAATECYQMLSEMLPECTIGLLHGKLKNIDKTNIINQFKNNQINILVATTVIEVGVDVPNASLMIIENPERLGLAQLHQLRGRVGRGSKESFCVLLYKTPLSDMAQARLDIMRNCQDGFILSEYDLKLRGAGEIMGKRQTGMWQLKIADLVRDKAILCEVREACSYLNKNYKNTMNQLVTLWLGDSFKWASV